MKGVIRIIGAVLIVGVAVLWVLGMIGDPHAVDLGNRLAGPSATNLLGTDHLGRDLATRVIWGALPSLTAIVIVLSGGLCLGVVAGSLTALGPPFLRGVIGWVAETTLALPTLVMALVLSAIFGAGITTIALALLITSWAPYALTIAALFDRIRGEQYWQASIALGVPMQKAVWHHMLPNAWPMLGALAGADAGRAVIVVASLGFIGLSADTGRPEWGSMIHEYRMFLFSEPRLVLVPIVACAVASVFLHLGLDSRQA